MRERKREGEEEKVKKRSKNSQLQVHSAGPDEANSVQVWIEELVQVCTWAYLCWYLKVAL